MTKNNDTFEIDETLGIEESVTRAGRARRWLVVAAGLLAAIGLVAWMQADHSQMPVYETSPVEKGDLVVTVTATGSLEPINQVDVGSELSGIVESVAVDFNDTVRAGQVLATLDTGRLEAQVLETRASLRSAEAKVRDAEATLVEKSLSLDRVRELVRKELSAPSELDAAKAAFQRAQADVASATAQVAQVEATLNARQTDLGKAVIRSPISGVVLNRAIEPGQTVAASLQAPVLFTLAEDLKQMELHVAIDEADIGHVRVGQSATFSVDAHPGRSFPAGMTQIRYASETVDGVVTYEAVLRVDNTELLLRPGMTATAEIVVETVENAVLVPNAALRFELPGGNQGSAKRSGSIIGAILPRRPPTGQKRPPSNDSTGQKVWMLGDSGPVAVAVTTGVTDGEMSEVLVGDLEPGLTLVVDIESGGRS
jgi:HlyD family secretion protein